MYNIYLYPYNIYIYIVLVSIMLLRQFYNPTIATLHTNCTNNKHQPVYPFVSLHS